MKIHFLLSTILTERVLLLMGAVSSGLYEAHTSIPDENLFPGVRPRESVCVKGGG